MQQYEFTQQSRVRADANAAGALFERLESENRLTAADVVDESRPEDAPLHKEFEWDDSVAGELYRQDQARHIIRSIRVVTEKKEPQRLYFNIVREEPQYRSIKVIMQSEDQTQLLLKRALGELISFQNRYREIKELVGVFEEIDKVKRQFPPPET